MIVDSLAALVFALSFGVLGYRISASRRGLAAGRRLAPGRAEDSTLAWAKIGAKAFAGLPNSWQRRLLDKADQRVARLVGQVFHGRADLRSVYGWRLVAAGGAFLGVASLAGRTANGLILAAVFAAAAQVVPLLWVRNELKRRRASLASSLPDFIDMAAIGVEAGLTFDRAAYFYCEKFDNPAAHAFREVLDRIKLGKPRTTSLQEMARDWSLVELDFLVAAIIQSEKLGAPLVKALKNQARSLRERRRGEIRELSAKAPVKMVFPIAGLILPSLLTVIIGPAALQFFYA